MKRILVVCTGNICRSPMTYGLLRAKIQEEGLAPHIQVETAGTYALEGEPPSHYAQKVLAERGIDISHHRARQITKEMLQKADLVIVMTESHRRSLFYLLPEAAPKVILLSELAGEHRDIADPYGHPYEAYVTTVAMLETYLQRGWSRLLRHLGLEEPPHGQENA